MNSNVLINLQEISKGYARNGQRLNILDNVSLTIKRGESCAILGASGSGKSTLLSILGLLDIADKGRYLFSGGNVATFDDEQLAKKRNAEIGFIFQSFNLIPRLSAVENVALPLFYRRENTSVALSKALAMLERVGMQTRAQHKPAELSGGQRQRVAIARALVTEPAVIFADEPTGNLDINTGGEILELLVRLNLDDGVTLIVVTHDPHIAARLKRQFVVAEGCVKEVKQ
ncbi:ABC transporter ATP-binding protein [Serratia quinivorans]|uniref:ABC transporter ATP-binding protein n=1 Tax=Serratia quinivorans TaxID=137545 RepID=UPI00217A2372|nr:ABC transporter ATP-binding protein [Serratia quinivorans]CAI0969585.1 Lipoprotein-releasing system ATP-binding protein LolD [Serratia quinivorans]CAI1711639.1 Lipoprotein-releasing system ATP-binding protein LolD [Serratia quinivorans]